MNRSRRRKQEKLTADEVQTMKKNITTHAVKVAYQMVLAIGMYTLRKNNGFGKKRLKEFKDNLDDTIIAYDKGEITKETILSELKSQDIEIKF